MAEDDILKMVVNDLIHEYENCGTPEIYTDFTETTYMVPMRDGISLETFVYMPKTDKNTETGTDVVKKWPVILQRTCYPFWDKSMKVHGEMIAKRGYVFIYQYCRGQHGSEGEWKPNIYERNDGIDTIDWICCQPWAGRIGVWGRSYGALIGWAMADAVEGKVASMFLGVYGTDRFASAYQKGSFRHDVLTSWTMENAGYPIKADYLESCKYHPQANVDEAMWGGRIDWYRDYILNQNIMDDYWQGGWWKELREIPAKVHIPLYVISGWYDHHHGSSMLTWKRLNPEAKAHSWLEVTGLDHIGFKCLEDRKTDNDIKDEIKKMFKWFKLTLVEGKLPEKKATFYEINTDSWHEFDDIDAADIGKQSYFLNVKTQNSDNHAAKENVAENNQENSNVTESIKTLLSVKPQNSASISYIYDPENPVMTHGAESLLHTRNEVGSLKQPDPDYRDDVLSFVSEPLEKDISIFGKVKVKLWVKSDCEDTAFTAKLIEVRPDGTAYNIRSSITTIAADVKDDNYIPNTPVQVEIDMWEIFYHIKAGCRLRLDISSSDFPQYSIHSNFKGKWALQEKTKKAHQTILCGNENASEVILPILKKL